jgi:cytochrome c-type biogenesis protein CcmH
MHAGYLQDSRNRFATLLSLGPPAAVSDAIAKQIAGLDADIAAANTAASRSADTAIHLNIELAPALQGRVPAGASLFVFVRSPQGGAPLAAKRLPATFPQRVDLSAADSMIAGNAIRKGQRVLVVARISASGTPTASAGDLSGQLSALAGQGTQHRLLISAPTAPGSQE